MITFAIVHAPTSALRAANVARLRAQLAGAIVVEDDGAELRIGERRGCWPVARRAWEAAPAVGHHAVLEDDAVLCDRFAELAAQAVARRPDAAISYFWGDRGCSVATSMPAALVSRFLAWADVGAVWVPHHDVLIRSWCRVDDVPHLHTDPSLVQHGTIPSLLDHGTVKASRFEQSPDTFDLVR